MEVPSDWKNKVEENDSKNWKGLNEKVKKVRNKNVKEKKNDKWLDGGFEWKGEKERVTQMESWKSVKICKWEVGGGGEK